MKIERKENPWLVLSSCLLAIVGVVALRICLRLDYQLWAVAYVAMGLTASIRRTSRGNDCSLWSALRGVACLAIGLYAIQKLGYSAASIQTAELVPEEIVNALDRVQ